MFPLITDWGWRLQRKQKNFDNIEETKIYIWIWTFFTELWFTNFAGNVLLKHEEQKFTIFFGDSIEIGDMVNGDADVKLITKLKPKT